MGERVLSSFAMLKNIIVFLSFSVLILCNPYKALNVGAFEYCQILIVGTNAYNN